MKKKEAEELGALVRRFLRQEGLETPLNEYRAVAVWPEVAGSVVARATSGVTLRNSTLYVKVAKPALRQELMMRRTGLARSINERVGAQVVLRIVFH